MHPSSLAQPGGPRPGGIWGDLPRGRRDPVSPGTKRNAMSTWFPLTPEIFFFFFSFFRLGFLQLCWGGGKAAAPAGEELDEGR